MTLRDIAGLPPAPEPKPFARPTETPQEITDRALREYSDALTSMRNSESKVVKTFPVNITGLLSTLRKRHPIRVQRIIRDLEWLHRKGARYGVRVVRGR